MENNFDKTELPGDEPQRVDALRRYRILDTPPEDAFDYVAQLATKIFGVPISLVSLVDKENVFFKANVGLGDLKTADRGLSLCSYAVLSPEVTVFENIAEEPCLLADPYYVNQLGLGFYAGAPLISFDGYEIGTVCVIDKKARSFSEHEKELLAGLAKIVMHDLELRLAAIKKADEFQRLQRELATVNEELSSTNEEVAATNEELSASVEELRSTNEDLEQRVVDRTTGIQFANEELNTVNKGLLNSQGELSAGNEKLKIIVKELSASEQNTRNIVNNAPFPIGIYQGREMRIILANQSIIDVWGKGNAVIGKLYAEVLPELENQEVFNQLDEVFNSGITFNARNQRIDLVVAGKMKIHYFNYSFTALRDDSGYIYGVMNTAADVTDIVLLKQQFEEISEKLAAANEELGATNEELITTNEELGYTTAENQNIYNELVQSRNDLIFTINAADLGTFDLNPVTNRFTGNDLLKRWFGLQPEDEIELSKATDVIAETDRQRVINAILKALDYSLGGNYDTEYAIINPNDPIPRIVRAKGKTLFNEKHEPIRLSGTLQDITEQKRDDQRKSDFIGMVSHELKTPLTSLTAIVQIANNKLKNSEDTFLAGAMEKAQVQVKRMSNMINGFLNVSRLESGKITINKTDFDLGELLTDTIKENELSLATHVIQVTKCEHVTINADKDKIGSVISNLLSNAVKYSPKETTIEVRCELVEDQAQISVTDHGIGIKKQDIEKLFDRYYRVNNNTAHISGFGIGLYLSAEIVQRHHGKIWVESEGHHGSTFYFSVPTT